MDTKEKMVKTRLEHDSIGTKEVPAEAYYGVQTLSLIHIQMCIRDRSDTDSVCYVPAADGCDAEYHRYAGNAG